ncbi:factor of DNA methylation 1-like [Pistacia vera]|uniref:factor of DNA methylation 1-like n=1 Tax=Pistacia vera TaxID=55513 RepID=UPI001263BA5D|nr:factor of DNA methylation 1-like [Pistacia vera]XP_031269971.1 factor of DNA methylation 1-like [Pistacia vera]XP_031269973.1 factor of DNA methylation 1-like [Pistacia vera]
MNYKKHVTELIQVFVDILGGRTTIGIKKMGEIDPKPFQNACKQKFSPEEAQVQASTLCSLWQKNLKNPEWHPFKIIEVGGNAKPEVLISKCKQYLYLLHMDYNFFQCE